MSAITKFGMVPVVFALAFVLVIDHVAGDPPNLSKTTPTPIVMWHGMGEFLFTVFRCLLPYLVRLDLGPRLRRRGFKMKLIPY